MQIRSVTWNSAASRSVQVVCAQLDADCDGILDGADNCPTVSNASQADSDVSLANGPNVAGNDATLPGRLRTTWATRATSTTTTTR